MPSILVMIQEELPPTATYARRSFMWLPGDGAGPDHRDGTLTITLQKGRRAGSKIERDTYAVERVAQDGSNREGFYLVNLTDPEQEDVYQCRPAGAVHPGYVSCTCTAGNCKVPNCKHRDALAKLIELGAL
jgi:hypothetical protein